MGNALNQPMGYSGPERRVHRVFVTHNTEYHVRAGVCVAVRDRASGEWRLDHEALGHKISGSIHYPGGDGFLPSADEPDVGDALYFQYDNRELVTSKVELVDRPQREVIAQYPGH